MLEPVMVTARAPPDEQLQFVLLFCVKSIYISKLLTVLVSFVPLGPNTWQEHEGRLLLAHSLRDFQSGTEEGKADVSSVRAKAWDDTVHRRGSGDRVN